MATSKILRWWSAASFYMMMLLTLGFVLGLQHYSTLWATQHVPASSLFSNAHQKESEICQQHQCEFCKSIYSSRNALFRHIRSECGLGSIPALKERYSVALFLGYVTNTKVDITRVLPPKNSTFEIISKSQASANKAQPWRRTNIAAALDVLIVNVLCNSLDLDQLTNQLQLPRSITLHGATLLNSKAYLDAETSCTQRVYHYLLPMSWLPDPDGLLNEFYYNNGAPGRRPTPTSLKQLKQVLRLFESSEADRYISSRFGLLGRKEKRHFHNYCSKQLSPQSARRIVDWARCRDVVGEKYMLLEIKGDRFLPEQVQRIVATAVAVLNGWLPIDFVTISLNARHILETPVAPIHLLYLAESRYHFYEQSQKGKRLWDDVLERLEEHPIPQMQRQLLASIDDSLLTSWLVDLEKVVTPRIRAQLQKQFNQSLQINEKRLIADAQDDISLYMPVLRMLQEIVERDQWPSTSVARSNVIAMEGIVAKQSGSFTVVSDDIFDCTAIPLPLGNTLFPELMKAVFALEQQLIALGRTGTIVASGEDENKNIQREPSSHCAINACAQFIPHVDSGRGSGQSLSMIVGLGDFTCGELTIENVDYDIRYKPLQFDGWKLRHWTRPFAGQRFSLVWFTPEGMQRNAL